MHIVNIIPTTKIKPTYLEEIQENKVYFSFATKEGEDFKQMHHWFVCRDFLGDVIYSNWRGKNFQAYNFMVNPKKDILDKEHCYILLKYSPQFEIDLKLLNDLEGQNGFEFTRLVGTNSPDVFLFVGDKKWQSSVFLMSLYSLLLKIAVVCPEESWEGNFEWFDTNYSKETFYMKILKESFELLTKNLHKFVLPEGENPTGYKEEQSDGTNHNLSGWISMIKHNIKNNKLKDIWNQLLSDMNPVPVAEKQEETEKGIISAFGTTIPIVSVVGIEKKWANNPFVQISPMIIYDDIEEFPEKKKLPVKKKKKEHFAAALFQKQQIAGLKGLA